MKAYRNITISFGLMNIPVGIAPIVKEDKIPGRTLCAKDHTPLNQKWYCPAEDATVTDTVKGYEHEGEIIVVEDTLLDNIKKLSDKTVALDEFVDLESIDPAYFDKSYVCRPPDKNAAHGYKILAQALKSTGLCAVGKAVLLEKEKPVVFRYSDKIDGIVMETLSFEADCRWNEASKWLADVKPEKAVTPVELAMAEGLLNNAKGTFDPERYVNTFNEGLRDLIAQAASGTLTEAPKAKSEAEPMDYSKLLAEMVARKEVE